MLVRSVTPARRAASASASTSARGSAEWSPGTSSASRSVGASAGSSRRAALGSSRSTSRPRPTAQRELALERLGFVAVAGDDERAAAAQPGIGAGGRLELRGELRPRARAAQPELEQRELAGVGLGDGRQHPGRDARGAGAELAALEHADGEAALRRAPGDGQPDDAPADDGDVARCGWVLRHDTSLRRHDPDQLLTVGVVALSARARGLPYAVAV